MSAGNDGIQFPWIRRIRVTFDGMGGGQRFYESDGTNEHGRIIARIEKYIQGVSNSSIITMFNLSEDTRSSFHRSRVKVTVEAGWDKGNRDGGKLFQCFKGTIHSAVSQRAGPDIVTTLSAISGIDDINLIPSLISKPPGYSVNQLVKELAGKLEGVTVDSSRIKDISATVGKGGWNHTGTIRTSLDALSKEFGFSWNVTDQTFQACKDEKNLGDGGVIRSPYLIDVNPVLNGQGMLMVVNGLRIRCTFNAGILPMQTIQVESDIEKRFNGVKYIVQSVGHELDCFNAASFITSINTLTDPEAIRKSNPTQFGGQ